MFLFSISDLIEKQKLLLANATKYENEIALMKQQTLDLQELKLFKILFFFNFNSIIFAIKGV